MKVIKSENTTQFFAFDSFIVDTAKSVLLDGERVVSLTPKAFELLLVLVQHPGSVLKKEELLELVWANTFVDENNLPRTISALRKALGEDPTEHKYIVTVPGQGYRFVAEVREVESPEEVVGHEGLVDVVGHEVEDLHDFPEAEDEERAADVVEQEGADEHDEQRRAVEEVAEQVEQLTPEHLAQTPEDGQKCGEGQQIG